MLAYNHRLRPRTLILVDVENGGHGFLEGIRAYTHDVLVILVLPQDNPEKPVKFSRPHDTPWKPLADVQSSRCWTGIGKSRDAEQPKVDWVWQARAASNKSQAVDVKLTRMAISLVDRAAAFRHGNLMTVSLDDAREVSITLEPVFDVVRPHVKRYEIEFRDCALLIAAGSDAGNADARYDALVEELRVTCRSDKARCIFPPKLIQRIPANTISNRIFANVDGTIRLAFTEDNTLSLPFCPCGIIYKESPSYYSISHEELRQHMKEHHPQCSCKRIVTPWRASNNMLRWIVSGVNEEEHQQNGARRNF